MAAPHEQDEPLTGGDGQPDGITVSWHGHADADQALRLHVADVVGTAAEHVRVGRLCRECGSTEHGRPWAGHDVSVSLARSGSHLVTAVSTVGPVGVDVESVTDIERAWPDIAHLVDGPTVERAPDRAAAWCRTEALLKAEGTGFGSPRPAARAPSPYVVVDLAAPTGYRAALAYEAR